MRSALSRPARLFAFPPRALENIAALAGQRDRIARLTRSLEVDSSEATNELGWTAQVGFETALEDMAGAYRGSIA